MDNHFFHSQSQSQDCFFNPNLDSPFTSMLPLPTSVITELGNVPRSNYTTPLTSPNLSPELPKPPLCATVDPGFAERAARFSCFGSRSFNGLEPNNNGIPLVGNGRLPRVSSTPLLKNRSEAEEAISQDESTVCEANPNANSRKRRAKVLQNYDPIPRSKKCNEKEGKTEEEVRGDGKQRKNIKASEDPKDYIHVRARRGQATDSHSLAERVRREKISERMKLLQDLVPGCNKVTGKALMLDEIINYVQSLQRQVEFLSMKLACVNPRLDTLMSKDIFEHNSSMSRPIFPQASTFFDHQIQIQNTHQTPPLTQCSTASCSLIHPLLHLPSLHHFTATTIPPVESPAAYYEGDLQTIFHMDIGQNLNPDPDQDFHGIKSSGPNES